MLPLRRSLHSLFIFSFLLFQCIIVIAHPTLRPIITPRSLGSMVETPPVCRNEDISPYDYSVKKRVPESAPICPVHTLLSRQVTNDDFSCSETKPCSNGACCSKVTGYCNYGPEACGTNGQSPNDVCWSNCNAHAECGRYAETPGKTCPLNVCCGPWGFCGMTEEFCTKSDDITKGCQSNCDQPGSGKTGGNVQKNVIGYYEAWAHDRSCTGMDFKDIPVGGLTHLYFSFGFITPGDLSIVPMDGMPFDLFTQMTDLKKRNSGLKCVIALGGWTFNDPGPTQTVFSDMVSTKANRDKFIANLFSFMREFAFDGVDFDWEYPGADDRGGRPEDGINFTQFLKELREAIAKQPIQYVVSFTIPTSYWYLRHFDLKCIEYVDFVNVMSYDLHGTWDSTNPIGNNVLAHTNMTEIKLALDLMWRNSVDPAKLNLGIGFYGRSFQLSDPGCYKPGCKFKGGAAPGGCTANSGTLSYKEIVQIIDEYKLTPFYDKESEVKYIVWNQDQWVSYDDEVTIKAKIDFANNLGLGGLLIWSVDQDTMELAGLKAILEPKPLNVFLTTNKDAAYWQDVTAQDCYVTECGGSCDRPGFIKVTSQPCGGAAPVTRRAKEKDSSLCCPITSAPDPKNCRWRGSAPGCNGHCENGEVALQLNKWGDGKYCEGGHKAYCCDVPAGKDTGCYWTGPGGRCNSGDQVLTFHGTFLQTIADIASWGRLFGTPLSDLLDSADIELSHRFCCSPQGMKRWKNCDWYGTPGSCDDNHCNIGHQVQLTQSDYGAGQSCAPRLERTRVFCCDAADGEALFPPVPLGNLFPNPPAADDPVDFDIKIDNTWGDGIADTSVSNDPDQATFGFWILTSPEEIQISLNKRDGSHWELFNCENASHDPDEEKTIQMICTDTSENSNCNKIYLGHGVPGTIVELPEGCGPSKYAVAKSMDVSKNQTLPTHLARRDFGEKPVVYDLTFDFEWRRVPRDLGSTQMRVDFSNEVGYWDNIVEKAASSKRSLKRSLADTNGSHKRWLEDEWRDDFHGGAVSKDELHKRWFGSDIISWLKGLLSPNISPRITHDISESFTAILVQEDWEPCTIAGGIEVSGNMDVRATASVKVSTSFGLTIIATLGTPLDLSNSYLFFKNHGEVSAIFTLDAEGKAVFQTGDKEIVGLQNFPGATFTIPKLLTVGPNFKLYASAEADVTLSGHLESRVDIANWDIQQSYPNPSTEYDPKAISAPRRDMTLQGLRPPTFDYTIRAEGQLTAHLKPSIIFGIDFDPMWGVGSAKVSVVADGWMRMHAKAEASSNSDTCPFQYGIDAGADLYAKLEVPSMFSHWNGQTFPIASIPAKKLVDGSCPDPGNSLIRRQTLGHRYEAYDLGSQSSASDLILRRDYNGSSELHSLAKRATYGPMIKLPTTCFVCPNPEVAGSSACEDIEGWEGDENINPDFLEKRSFGTGDISYEGEDYEEDSSQHLNFFEKRGGPKKINFCANSKKMLFTSPKWDESGTIVSKISSVTTYAELVPQQCNDFTFGIIPNVPKGQGSEKYASEHVLEFQLIPKFLDAMKVSLGDNFPNLEIPPNPKPNNWKDKLDLCKYMAPYWDSNADSWITIPSRPADGAQRATVWLGKSFPSRTDFTDEWVILAKGANTAKERMWGDGNAVSVNSWPKRVANTPDRAIKNIKDFIMAYKYHKEPAIKAILKKQAERLATNFEYLEDVLITKQLSGYNTYQKIGLKSLWEQWLNGRAALAIKKAEDHMKNGVNDLVTKHGNNPDTEPNANKKILKGKIKALQAEVNQLTGTLTNMFV